ncbi:hypothetical protein BDY19DRAFT_565195 [Irpex rosettiformis]|uniref:Uncharacterized protein n=1 Tax=Irpex rosettiformis TaxID=378272 RepID=A0ACB8UD51_9APHY|nr:hypothetical protein BDY19DRAFT_565195 [Irpex rosettiformis]
MPLFRQPRSPHTTTHTVRKDTDHMAGGYKAALANPNTTRAGREHAKHELRAMGRGREAHVPLTTKIKRAFGIHSTPRKARQRERNHERFTTTRTRRTHHVSHGGRY